MKRVALVVIAALVAQLVASAQPAGPAIYISPTGDGFDVYVAAAITKKKVPVTLLASPDRATLTMNIAQVQVEKVSTGSKWVKCLFAYCAGAEDKASVSVQLVDAEGAIVWSYAVNKGRGSKNLQSMAEAIAKHLKSDYLRVK